MTRRRSEWTSQEPKKKDLKRHYMYEKENAGKIKGETEGIENEDTQRKGRVQERDVAEARRLLRHHLRLGSLNARS